MSLTIHPFSVLDGRVRPSGRHSQVPFEPHSSGPTPLQQSMLKLQGPFTAEQAHRPPLQAPLVHCAALLQATPAGSRQVPAKHSTPPLSQPQQSYCDRQAPATAEQLQTPASQALPAQLALVVQS